MTTTQPERPDASPGAAGLAGKIVLVTGTASGIGAATRQALLHQGATVIALDRTYLESDADNNVNPELGNGPAAMIGCDLSDPASIDAAISRLPSQIDAVMNCAGVPNGGRFSPAEVMAVNWLGLRRLTEAALERMASGSAVVNVASTAGRNWPDRTDHHRSQMKASTFEEGQAWVAEHGDLIGDGYAFSKEAVQYYTMWRAVQLLPRGVRMNSVCPGITNTGIIADFRKGLGDEMIDHAAAVAGRFAQPEEMAGAMLFLADSAVSSYVNGVNLNIDNGTGAARLTGQSDPAKIWGGANAER